MEEEGNEAAGWRLARRGIHMALNNEVEGAQELLKAEVDGSGCPQAQAGFCFIAFMNAVMTFEEEKMAFALASLKAAEKRCSSNSPTATAGGHNGLGLGGRLSSSPSFSSLQSMKSRFQGLLQGQQQQGYTRETTKAAPMDLSAVEALRLERQIIVADCQVLAAVLNFLRQDWGSYMRGGWVLRKAWKIYYKAYAQIRKLYIQRVGLGVNGIAPPPVSSASSSTPQSTSPSSTASSSSSSSDDANSNPSSGGGSPDASVNDAGGSHGIRRASRGGRGRISHSISVPLGLFSLATSGGKVASDCKGQDNDPSNGIPVATVKRLMSAVSFGYGIFHLAVSLLPPKLLHLINAFGFEGDRQTGIQALHFSRQGIDMRGPLATLALLWFHTIVRPFFGLDGSNLKSGADAAQRLIEASRPEFANSALFLFFQGRVERLKSNFAAALGAYERALVESEQREVRLLCLHEVGWSQLLLLRWELASRSFLRLKSDSRWSKSFYSYLSAVSLGASGDVLHCLELARETPQLARGKGGGNQLERFLLKRASKMASEAEGVDAEYCRLLGYELLYLWNALGACLKHSQSEIRIDCDRISVPSLEGVRQLILGSVHSNAGAVVAAKQSYGRAIKHSSITAAAASASGNMNEVASADHTAAFASYELGLLLCRDPATRSDGRHYLEYARDNYRNYDFETRLSVRIHAALRFHSEDATVRCQQQIISA